MKRRNFFRNTALATLGVGIAPVAFSNSTTRFGVNNPPSRKAKNIIFMVSDGMSTGTLTMADHMSQRMLGYQSHWMKLMQHSEAKRALMDTRSADSLVTDSAAGGSAWGCGVRVNNGRLNWGEKGEKPTPILQKFKKTGKAVGCVTTVPITHATPASFCVNNESRKNQPEIAKQYLDLKFDVMLGGGQEYFLKEKRRDGEDVMGQFRTAGYHTAISSYDLFAIPDDNKPVMGVFHESAMPYAVDRRMDKVIRDGLPSLPEMTKFAIQRMSKNTNGFVLQVEGGKVDWAAHGNDVGGLIFDQLEFDEALMVALDFAEKDGNTLVIVTTDHGNANPGLFYGRRADFNFDNMQNMRYSNEWVLKGLSREISANDFIERVHHAQNIRIKDEEAAEIVAAVSKLGDADLTNEYKLPFERFAQIQKQYTSVGWGDMNHSSDFVEVTMFGPGSEMLMPHVQNYELHNFMLTAAEVSVK
jgi:alkaline phosphatase